MKTLLLPALLLVVITGYSQNFKLAKNEVDEFTGKLEREIDMVTIGNIYTHKFQALLSQVDSTFMGAFYTSGDMGCGSPRRSSALIKFEDGELLNLPYQGDIDCGTVLLFNALDAEEIAALKTKRIAKIRYTLERQVDVNIKYPDFFIKAFAYLESAPKPKTK